MATDAEINALVKEFGGTSGETKNVSAGPTDAEINALVKEFGGSVNTTTPEPVAKVSDAPALNAQNGFPVLTTDASGNKSVTFVDRKDVNKDVKPGRFRRVSNLPVDIGEAVSELP